MCVGANAACPGAARAESVPPNARLVLDPVPLVPRDAAVSLQASAQTPLVFPPPAAEALPGSAEFKTVTPYFLFEYRNVLLFKLLPHATLKCPQELNFVFQIFCTKRKSPLAPFPRAAGFGKKANKLQRGFVMTGDGKDPLDPPACSSS